MRCVRSLEKPVFKMLILGLSLIALNLFLHLGFAKELFMFYFLKFPLSPQATLLAFVSQIQWKTSC